MADDVPFIGNRLIIFVSIFTPLTLLCVVLRFWARSLTPRRLGLDDWLVVASLLGQFVATGLCIGCIKQAGVGYHVEWIAENHPEVVTTFFKYLLVISTWYWLTISLSKLAICIFYRTLFPQKLVMVVLCIAAGIMICTAIASIIAGLAACHPFDAQWAAPAVQADKCYDKETLYVWSTFPNIITDLVLLGLPLPVIWKLHTSTHLKVALSGTFVLGSIGIVASVLRFVAFSNTSSFTDATWNAVELYIWTLAEPGIYLIASCLITYRPLLEKISPKSSTKATSSWPSKQLPSAAVGRSGYSRGTSRTPPGHSFSMGTYGNDNDEGILLDEGRGYGYEQRYIDSEANPAIALSQSEIPAQGIVKTINVQMSWNAAKQGAGHGYVS